MKFLIVDDDSRMRHMIRRTIERTVPGKNDIVECDDGLDALVQYECNHPDWVLMDIEMRGMDGIAASELIKRTFPDAQIIILTQFDSAEYRDLAQKIGVKAYLLKDEVGRIKDVIEKK